MKYNVYAYIDGVWRLVATFDDMEKAQGFAYIYHETNDVPTFVDVDDGGSH